MVTTRARRILVLAPFPPRLDGTHGGSRAIAHLVTALAVRNRVALAYLRARDETPVSPELTAVCDRVHEGRRPGYSDSSVRPWPRAFAALPSLAAGRPLWVAARWNAEFGGLVNELVARWRPHVVQAEFSVMAQYFPQRPHPCAVVTFHEPGAEAARERVDRGGPGALFWRLDRELWQRFERRVLERADAAVVFTERDRTALRRLSATAPAAVIPLGVHVPDSPADPIGAEPPTLLFIGNFVHPPNLDAAGWLLDEIFPALRRRHPELRLALVGANPPAALRERQQDGVLVTGEVTSMDPYLDAATVVVAPLRQGGGMRVKVLEALGAGKALVATATAVDGLSLEHGVHALIADDGAALVEAIASLLEDAPRRRSLAHAGRIHVAARFSWNRAAAAYEALYDDLIGPPSAGGPVS